MDNYLLWAAFVAGPAFDIHKTELYCGWGHEWLGLDPAPSDIGDEGWDL